MSSEEPALQLRSQARREPISNKGVKSRQTLSNMTSYYSRSNQPEGT